MRASADSLQRSPAAPSWLSKDAKAEWKRLVPVLVARRVLTPSDLGCIESYCIAVGRVKELEKAIQSDPTDRQLHRVQMQFLQAARQYAAEIGATPVSRSKAVMGEASADAEADEMGI